MLDASSPASSWFLLGSLYWHCRLWRDGDFCGFSEVLQRIKSHFGKLSNYKELYRSGISERYLPLTISEIFAKCQAIREVRDLRPETGPDQPQEAHDNPRPKATQEESKTSLNTGQRLSKTSLKHLSKGPRQLRQNRAQGPRQPKTSTRQSPRP